MACKSRGTERERQREEVMMSDMESRNSVVSKSLLKRGMRGLEDGTWGCCVSRQLDRACHLTGTKGL